MTIFIIQLHQVEINNPHIEYNDTQLFTEVEDIYQSGGHFAYHFAARQQRGEKLFYYIPL